MTAEHARPQSGHRRTAAGSRQEPSASLPGPHRGLSNATGDRPPCAACLPIEVDCRHDDAPDLIAQASATPMDQCAKTATKVRSRLQRRQRGAKSRSSPETRTRTLHKPSKPVPDKSRRADSGCDGSCNGSWPRSRPQSGPVVRARGASRRPSRPSDQSAPGLDGPATTLTTSYIRGSNVAMASACFT